MESPSRGSRYSVSSRVGHKLGSDIALIAIPHRPRPRAATTTKLLDESPSLSGTTAPSSPTLAEFPGSGHGDDAVDNPPRPTTPQMKLRVHDADGSPSLVRDMSFRKHNRGIGSIDSMLSSTTCVNTQSDCSRPASRVSRAHRYDGGMPDVLMLEEAAKIAYAQTRAQDPEDLSGLVVLESLTPTHRMHFVSANSPAFSPSPVPIHADFQGEDVAHEETKVVNEISSWVLRSLWGKEVDECIAPLLVADCTNRYLQELWTAAEQGTLKGAAASPDQASSSPNTIKQESGGNGYGQGLGNGSGKGKRKADGGSDDGDEFDDSDGGKRDDGGHNITGAPRQPGRVGASSNFSCPYRKRNPLRFNVREYYVCATHSFADMSQLKKHIRAHHPPVQRNAGPFSCPRCFQGFPTKNDLDDHLRQPDVCHITFDQGGADPEDGITQKIIISLEARTLKLKIDNWVSLWKLLFPRDPVVPDPTFVPVMEVFDFVAESKKFLSKLRDLLELQYRFVLEEGAGQQVDDDFDRKIRQGLDRSTQSIYNWIEAVVQDWEQRFTGSVSHFPLPELSRIRPPVEDSWTGAHQLLPPSPALTPTVAPGAEASTATGSRDESPDSTNQSSVAGGSSVRRINPSKRIRRSDVTPKTQIPVPIQKARTPQPQSRTPSSSLRRPSGVPVLATQTPGTLPSNAPIQTTTRPTFPQQWMDYPPVSSPYATQYPVMTSSPGLPPQTHVTAPPQYSTTVPQSPFLPSEPTTPADHAQHQLQRQHVEGLQHDPSTTDPHHSATIRSSRFMGATPRTSLTSIWVRESNANRDSAQTLVEAHPPGPCQSLYCPSCSKTLPDGVAHPGMPQSGGGIHHVMGQGGMYEGGHGMMVGPGGYAMHVVGEEHGQYTAQGQWTQYPDGGVGIHGGGVGGGMFNHGGMQEGF
ncbi:hypothetical protein QBC34DRAFT_426518 [Podospora aff. communis PSN243]|uniref:C2H2-type domain-containing protein n=1 Tax=Podospora aff. communis PSN243 TaxID=3040156 RepID=A0AAV9GKH9_9PEZI|nr:hypothetical protein QBC34DRAFT_426518 [Podospora aff. communis PSN243]